ncbi:MAG TPA: aspartate 1-decarboxylase [Firmicutes bacterium]|nr:aspartate 1-decarboxylase [Bacillota bacterium]
MLRTMMHAKLHRGRVTETRLDYVGSITIDRQLLEEAGILENERVQVLNLMTGERMETYTIAGEPGSGVIGINGAAARRFQVGDQVIIIAYGLFDEEEARRLRPRVLILDDENRVVRRVETGAPAVAPMGTDETGRPAPARPVDRAGSIAET